MQEKDLLSYVISILYAFMSLTYSENKLIMGPFVSQGLKRQRRDTNSTENSTKLYSMNLRRVWFHECFEIVKPNDNFINLHAVYVCLKDPSKHEIGAKKHLKCSFSVQTRTPVLLLQIYGTGSLYEVPKREPSFWRF